MSETLLQILLLPLGILLYASGLLIWPIRRWVRRGKVRGKLLGFAFLGQLASYVVVAICSVFIRLEHFYGWFVFVIELNIIFTIAAIVAWIRDVRYEHVQEASHAA